MISANRIAGRITAMRRERGWSQEELADRLGISRQAVSKWESAQTMPELDKAMRLSEIFGITIDELLSDEDKSAIYTLNADEGYDDITTGTAMKEKVIGDSEAENFISTRRDMARRIALGSLLCVLSPVLLILLAGFAEGEMFGVTETVAAVVGMVALFVFICVAVILFISCKVFEIHLDTVENGDFILSNSAENIVKKEQREFSGKYSNLVALGVGICIFASLPLIIAGIVGAKDYVCCALTALILVLISVAVYIFVVAVMRNNTYDMLLHEGEFNIDTKKNGKMEGVISAVYWCVVTAGYLLWSFITFDWHFTWIVWPTAAVLYGAVSVVAEAISKSENDKDGKQ